MPQDTLSQNAHLIRVLHLTDSIFHQFSASLLPCTNLTELEMHIRNDEAPHEGQITEQPTGKPTGEVGEQAQPGGQKYVAPELNDKQLLRSNSSLRTLHWIAFGAPGRYLDPEDFVGLTKLEDVTLFNWNCSGGRLETVLRALSGSLKKLYIMTIAGAMAEDFWTPIQGDSISCGENIRIGNRKGENEERPRLKRLEFLRWCASNISVGYLSQVVRCCPYLKVLHLQLSYADWEFGGLADILRIDCTNLESLVLSSPLKSLSFDTLIRHCSTSGLRKLHLTVRGFEGDLVSAIIQHATTLEDLYIHRDEFNMNGSHYLRLLVECIKLKRFSFRSSFQLFDKDILKTLKEQQWGCRSGLQELDLDLGFFPRLQYKSVMTCKIQEMANALTAAGWERVDDQGKLAEMTKLCDVLELVRFQKLEGLKTLTLDDVKFRPRRSL
ncbi:hypothetical protein BGZ96_004365 [Linnemannia gamsii]|uniref:F-box protein n=1 Tax=Linnemannia gamsii TaxID=64522 RepID=A0ABQ7K5T4_9FUNG|nr:hypothetical protein BGZ96_004365 [Linnemannia gamsii]